MRQPWRWLRLLLVLTPLSCGYSATPIEVIVDTVVRDTGELKSLTALGIADPAASSFDDGTMLSTRWATQRTEARTVELHIDLDGSGVRNTIAWGDEPVELASAAVTTAVIHRRVDGTVAFESTPDATVEVLAASNDGGRELSAGRFQMSIDDDESPYVQLQGTWQTEPPPPRVVEIPKYPPGDYTPGDPGPGDPGPGDPGAGDATGDTGGDDDTVVVFDSGCSCPGGDYEEDLPEEEEPDPEPAPEDTGGCDCVDTTGPDDPPPDPEPDPDVIRDDTGCDCVGDTGPEEDPAPDPAPDPETDTSSDTGCDCEGDTGPEEPTTEEWAALHGASLASYSESPRVSQKKTRPRRRCRRSPLRIGLELSPIFFLYLLSRWRRRRF